MQLNNHRIVEGPIEEVAIESERTVMGDYIGPFTSTVRIKGQVVITSTTPAGETVRLTFTDPIFTVARATIELKA